MSEVAMSESKETLEALDSISVPDQDQSVEMREAGPEATAGAAAGPHQLVVVHNLTSLDGTLVNNGTPGITTPSKGTRYRQRYRREWEDIPQFKGKSASICDKRDCRMRDLFPRSDCRPAISSIPLPWRRCLSVRRCGGVGTSSGHLSAVKNTDRLDSRRTSGAVGSWGYKRGWQAFVT